MKSLDRYAYTGHSIIMGKRKNFWQDTNAEGRTLKKITERVAEIFGIEKNQVVVAGKQPDRVRARSALVYWTIRHPGLTATEVGKYLGLSKSAVSRAATRGQKFIINQSLSLKD